MCTIENGFTSYYNIAKEKVEVELYGCLVDYYFYFLTKPRYTTLMFD